MAKKSTPNQDKYDREYDELTEDFDFNDDYEEGLESIVSNVFKTHFSKIDFALRLTQMALDNTTRKDADNNEEHVFDVYRRALKVINDSPPIEETLRQFGLMPEPQ